MKPAWRPRGSALGAYFSCMYRAAFDRAIHDALVQLSPEDLAKITEAKKSSPYADLGTCIHFATQDGLRCAWGHGTSATHAPDAGQMSNAATLFGGSDDRLRAAIRASSVMAATHLREGPWIAERQVITPYISGHIDFLSTDGKRLVDLKTTAKPPLKGMAKPAHLIQVLAYADALEYLGGKAPEKATILYVDSLSAAWAYPVHIDLTSEAMIEYRRQVREYATFLMTPQLFAAAVPQLGPACEEWCPYTTLCRDRINASVTSGAPTTPKPLTMKGPIT